MSHERVINVRARGATWDVYVGRGKDPRSGVHAGPAAPWGNPFKVEAHGPDAMRLYLDHLAAHPRIVAQARRELPGLVLGCWCAPRLCHGEVLARLADGEELEAIRADVLAQVEALRARGPAQRRAPAEPGPLFGGAP